MLRLYLASLIVDRKFYLERYPDVEQAGIDPVKHFSLYGFSSPIRAPNSFMDRLIFCSSPFIVMFLHLFGRYRLDLFDCLRFRLNELAASSSNYQYKLIKIIFGRIINRMQRDEPNQLCNLLGKTLKIHRPFENNLIGSNSVEVAAPHRFYFREPRIFKRPYSDQIHYVQVPRLHLSRYIKASVFGSAQVMCAGYLCIDELGADPRFRYTSRQDNFVITFFQNNLESVLARIPSIASSSISEGILLTGRCADNYFHFLIEYMTKGFIIEKFPNLNEVPIIIGSGLHSQQYEAINIIFPKRKKIYRDVGSRLDVENLYVPSTMTFLPDSPEVPLANIGALNKDSLFWLREKVLSNLDLRGARNNYGRKIFLQRTRGRNIINKLAVERAFINNGFEIVDPALLSFNEQVKLFVSAEVITGPIGAAFANIVFCNPGTKVYPIVTPFAFKTPLFSNLANIIGCEYKIIPGTHHKFSSSKKILRHPIRLTNGSYDVDILELETILKEI